MSDAPFFEPWPDPQQDDGADEPEFDHPYRPPVHVSGVVVPLRADVHRGADAVVQVTHVVAYRRGLEVHIASWVRPGRLRSPTSVDLLWHQQEPRVGFRLADHTRLGHRPPHGPAVPDVEEPAVILAQTGGEGGGLRFSSNWWLHPIPDGDTLEVFVQWDHQGVPESSAPLDLTVLRSAAEQEDVLWDPPPAPNEQSGGWFAFAPMSGESYRSSWSMVVDEPHEDSG
jgi:hypothetical protein